MPPHVICDKRIYQKHLYIYIYSRYTYSIDTTGLIDERRKNRCDQAPEDSTWQAKCDIIQKQKTNNCWWEPNPSANRPLVLTTFYLCHQEATLRTFKRDREPLNRKTGCPVIQLSMGKPTLGTYEPRLLTSKCNILRG